VLGSSESSEYFTRAVKEAIDLLEKTAKEAKQVAGRRTLAKTFCPILMHDAIHYK
jgi:hypothetical protein